MSLDRSAVARFSLPQITLCAVTSVNIEATVRALEVSLAQINVAACKLFTDASIEPRHPEIQVIPIARLGSSTAYSEFLLSELVDHVETSHCLVTQWDGHLLDAERWRADFLDYDYIGASWPQFDDGHDVGNGGFSLRSRRLMLACRDQGFFSSHPEDVAIGRINRDWLEAKGMTFAPRELADVFATERAGDLATSFGYHGVWHMPRAIGAQAFWEIYCGLDDRGTVARDFSKILGYVRQDYRGASRVVRMVQDHVRDRLKAVIKI